MRKAVEGVANPAEAVRWAWHGVVVDGEDRAMAVAARKEAATFMVVVMYFLVERILLYVWEYLLLLCDNNDVSYCVPCYYHL